MAVQSTTSTSSIDPALLPYLQTGLERAQSLFLTGKQPEFFQGQTYVSPSAQTQDALAQQEALARQQSPVLQQAQQAFTSGLQNIGQIAGGSFVNPAQAQLQNIASGSFLGSNPYQAQMMQAATRPLEQQFSNQVLPSIASLYSKSGRYGSGAMQNALGTATEGFGRALGDITGNIAGQQYQQERALQQQALGQLGAVSQQDLANRMMAAQSQSQLAAVAPSIYGQQFIPSQQLAQVGAAQEAIAAQPLQEQMARFNFGQQLPYQQLSGYLSSVYGSPMGNFGTQQQQTTMPSNPFINTAAGAGLGYLGGQALGSFISGNPFSLTSPTGYGLAGGGLGAALGGLLF
jgi:hypothetical protein